MASTDVGTDHGTLYHLVQQEVWQQCKAAAQPYFPPTYGADGFIHLTKEPQLLLGVANHFYTTVPGTFLVLAIDSTKLSSKVVFEAAAPVGDQPPLEKQQQFPHLYGTIDFAAVSAELPVERAADGTFLAIVGLPEQ
uniref:DUF952 domain-containing protein n=1 Tax=Tetradesmus obliquus TaxID=3088 RepID=A0A383VBQ5_TETOB|eukprot:jgi/Sobl393_1/11878/SZX62373.1